MAAPVFQERDGIVVIEMESTTSLPDNWRNASTSTKSKNINNPGDATGDGFIVWEGDQYFGQPGNSIITYQVQITTPGAYEFDWRSQTGQGTNTTEHNDTWLKIEGDKFYGYQGNFETTNDFVRPRGAEDGTYPDGAGFPNGSTSDGWFKAYVPGGNNWKWGVRTSDHQGYKIIAEFDEPGIYDIHIAARSSSHAIDRMMLSHVDAYDGNPRDLSIPESPRVEAGAPLNGAPIVQNETVVVEPGAAETIDVLSNDSDPEGDPLTITSVTPSAGVSAQITNDNRISVTVSDAGGPKTVGYTVSDGQGGTSNGVLTVAPDVASDFDGDGTSDVLWFNPETRVIGQYAMENGASSWGGVGKAGPNWTPEATGDFNGDGADDILWFNPATGSVGKHAMQNGKASWEGLGKAGPGWEIAGTGDFNGDATDDILWFNPTTGAVGQYVMQDGGASWQVIGKGGGAWEIGGAGDFDGDGDDDILWFNPETGAVGQFAMENGQPSWSGIGKGQAGYGLAGVGDFNGDGTDDILWFNPETGGVGQLVMQNGEASWSDITTIGRNWDIVATGDYNGDGTDDLLVVNKRTGVVGQHAMEDGEATYSRINKAGEEWGVISETTPEEDTGGF